VTVGRTETADTRAGRLRFSVVIPAFNEAGYLPYALESLRRQDFTGEWEIVVVDNNSTDDTAAIARRHGARVVVEPQPGVCSARQLGATWSRGEIIVSTDADTVHPIDWLTRLDERFRSSPAAVAVAGPCRYADPLWWSAAFPRAWFRAVAAVYALTGAIFYITATNIAYRADSFPGYDTTLTQGGDEFDFLRRLRDRGPVVWDADNPVLTSSRRMNQGLAYTLIVAFGYQYGVSYLLNRLSGGRIRRIAPAIRLEQTAVVRRRRRRWCAGVTSTAAALAVLAWSRRPGGSPR
jgi:glycosyltransferase involved in cell wall biosynthesis